MISSGSLSQTYLDYAKSTALTSYPNFIILNKKIHL